MEKLRIKRDEFRELFRREEREAQLRAAKRANTVKTSIKIEEDDLELEGGDDHSISSDSGEDYKDRFTGQYGDIIQSTINDEMSHQREREISSQLEKLFHDLELQKQAASLTGVCDDIKAIRLFCQEITNNKKNMDSSCALFLTQNEYLDLIISFLGGSLSDEKTLQLEVLWLLINMASTKNQTAVARLTDCSLLSKLHQLLQTSTSIVVKSDAIFCMTNLIIGNEAAKRKTAELKVPDSIYAEYNKVFSSSNNFVENQLENEVMKQAHTRFIARAVEFSTSYLSTKPWSASGAPELAVFLRKVVSKHLLTSNIIDVMVGLQVITSKMNSEEVQEFIHDNLDRDLFRLLKNAHVKDQSKLAVLRLLGDLSSSDMEGVVARFIEGNYLDLLKADLHEETPSEIIDLELFTLSNLTICKPEEAETFLNMNLFDLVVPFICNSDSALRHYALRCFVNFFNSADIKVFLKVVERYADMVEILLENLDRDKPQPELICLLSLLELFLKSEEYQEEVNCMTHLIKEKCMYSTFRCNLENLQTHYAYQVREMATKIIDRYFETEDDYIDDEFRKDKSDGFAL